MILAFLFPVVCLMDLTVASSLDPIDASGSTDHYFGDESTSVRRRAIFKSSAGAFGDSCYRNAYCNSGICSSTWLSSGLCVECKSDNHCRSNGALLRTEEPKPFCYTGDGADKARCSALSAKLGEEITGRTGDSCYRNDFCQSGSCSSTWFSSGVCVECNTDDDCGFGGVSLAGEIPKAFCYKGDGANNAKCSEFKRGEPVDEKGYPMVFPGSKTEWIARQVMDTPVSEQVWHWDLNNQPKETGEIRVNGTHILFPLHEHTVAGYSRSYHGIGQHESGVVSVSFLNNPTSVLTDRVVLGLAEKYHTLTYDGEMNTASADRIREELVLRDEKISNQATSMRKERDLAVGAAVALMNFPSKLVEANQDVRHLDQIREFALSEEANMGVKAKLESSGWQSHAEEAKQALVDARTTKPIKSENQCKHLEPHPKLAIMDNMAVIPLDTELITLSGMTQFSPLRSFGLGAGTLMARFHSSTNAVEMYYVATQQSHLNFETRAEPNGSVQPSGIWLSPANGMLPVSSEDGRTDEYYDAKDYNFFTQIFIRRVRNIPADYSRFDKDPNKVCPQKRKDALEPFFENAKLAEENAQGNVFDTITRGGAVLQAVIEGVDCGISYLRPDVPNTAAFDALELAVWAHLILEVDSSVTKDFATATFWDDWQEVFQ